VKNSLTAAKTVREHAISGAYHAAAAAANFCIYCSFRLFWKLMRFSCGIFVLAIAEVDVLHI
jgi:hypothetical protein